MSSSPNPNYRVEHVAEVPRGWRVRTKMQSTHMLRIAFPPGRKRKGAGKVVEIFHPVNENPCAMTRTKQREARERAERIRGARLSRGNPDTTGQAAELYEQFHGESPQKILELQESDTARKVYTGLGVLTELVIDAPSGTVKIGFYPDDAVQVASAPSGKQIYLLGGNQNISANLGRFGSDASKDFVLLGMGSQITYRARKSMDDFQIVDYYHDFGEETEEPPMVFYDRMKHRIFLAGGRYYVEARGIIN